MYQQIFDQFMTQWQIDHKGRYPSSLDYFIAIYELAERNTKAELLADDCGGPPRYIHPASESSKNLLKECPFCGSSATMSTMPEGSGSDGSMYVECNNSLCRASSALIYPLKDDVKQILVERWNKRTK